jgi:hypothetical protein
MMGQLYVNGVNLFEILYVTSHVGLYLQSPVTVGAQGCRSV